MKFSSAEVAVFRPFLKSPRVLISSHVRPDPDAIGSVLALREAVLQCGGTPVCVMEDECPARCKLLFGANDLLTMNAAASLATFDDVIIVDSGNRERIGDVERLVAKTARIANLDHHISNTNFGHVNLVDVEASASGELLFGLFGELGITLTETLATNLLAGILTDTGRFRHSNTTPATLRTAANLVEGGARLSQLTEQLYFTIPVQDVRSSAQILSSLELHVNGRVSTMFVSLDYAVEDPDNLVDLGRAIDGVEVAVLLSEMNDGRIRVSMRSKSLVNVSAIAESFGGGGHERAAGFRMYGTLRSVQARLLPSLMHALDTAS